MAKHECVFGNYPDQCSGKVQFREDPYSADVHNDHTKVWICEGHQDSRAEDV